MFFLVAVKKTLFACVCRIGTPPLMVTFVIEHLEEEFYPWCQHGKSTAKLIGYHLDALFYP
jgi:hypothetical protein